MDIGIDENIATISDEPDSPMKKPNGLDQPVNK